MSKPTALLVLLLAACLEAGGDAMIRFGLMSGSAWQRWLLIGSGGLVLALYGLTVNAPPWDFGKLLGLYVVFFFLIAQAISWAAFKQPPTSAVWIGGALIVAGGCVIAFSRS